MIRMYQMRLADLEYREGLGSVSAVPLRRTLLVLGRRTLITRLEKRGGGRARGEKDEDDGKLLLGAEEDESD